MTIEAAIVTSQTQQTADDAELQSTDDTTTGDESNPEGEEVADTSGEDTDANSTDDSSLETYADFTLPEGLTLDDAQLESATPLFKELGLTQEQAQKLVDFQAAQVQAGQQGQMDAFTQLKDDWLAQSKADKEFGGDKFEENVGIAKQAIAKFGSEGFNKLLNDFGLGNHPEVIRLMTKVGRLTKEDNPDDTGNNVNQGPRDHVSVLYPTKS